jgi:hypothetical protein
MGKEELHPRLMSVLIKKAGQDESSIRPTLSTIRRRYNVSLNAAAFIFAQKHGFSTAAYLSDKDRDSLKHVSIEKTKIPIIKIKREKRIIEIARYDTIDTLLKLHLIEINKAYTAGCYTSCFILCRKVLENLLIHKIIIRKYPTNKKEHKERYFDFSKNRFLDFEKILKNLRSSSNDFGNEKKLVERICQLSDAFKEHANEMTHSLYHIASKREIDEKNFQHLLDLIKKLEDSIYS